MSDVPFGGRALPPLRVGELMRGAVTRLRTHMGELWPVWLGATASSAVTQYLARATNANEGAAQLAPTYLACLVGTAAFGSFFSGIALRILLGRGTQAWQVDAPLGRYMAYGVVATAAPIMAFFALLRAPGGPTGEAAVSFLLLCLALLIVAYFVFAWATLRLLIWQTGLVMDEPSLGLARGWRLGKGAVLSFLAASMGLCLVPVLLGAVGSTLFSSRGGLGWLAVGVIAGGISQMVFCAIAAEIYRARVGAHDVAAIFD